MASRERDERLWLTVTGYKLGYVYLPLHNTTPIVNWGGGGGQEGGTLNLLLLLKKANFLEEVVDADWFG
jgi:hypothetical protein